MRVVLQNKMSVEVWSDVMCPFCYIGKRHYEAALAQFAESSKVEIIWHSFQLDPNITNRVDNQENVYDYLAKRKGISYEESVKMHGRVLQMAKEAGLEFHLEKALVANSFNAHRLIQMAKTKGLGDEAEEFLFKAYFSEAKDFGDPEVLAAAGKSIGLTEAEFAESQEKDEYAYLVRQDIQEAQNMGIRGVPFFIFDGKYTISGAQPTEQFLATLKKSFVEWRKIVPVSKLKIAKREN